MDVSTLQRHFARLDARLQVHPFKARNRWQAERFTIDIGHDKSGEFFDVAVPTSEWEKTEMLPLEVRPDLRHLLLLVRRDGDNEKYLCGHDERHFFVAGAGDNAVKTVAEAMESLRPTGISERLERVERRKNHLRRRNAAFLRQGEWFFLPAPDFVAPDSLILKHEPLSRGNGSKPHWCEEIYREGGDTVYVCQRHPNGISTAEYNSILANNTSAKYWGWRLMKRNPTVYARGAVRHADHATIVLPCWHEVKMNREERMSVVFLD